MTFKEGDIVRLITEDNNGEAMRVLDINGQVAHVAVGNDDGERWLDAGDLELHPTQGFGSPIKEAQPIELSLEQKIEGELSSIAFSVDRIRDFLKGM